MKTRAAIRGGGKGFSYVVGLGTVFLLLIFPSGSFATIWHGVYTDATSYAPGDEIKVYVSSPPTNGVVRLVRLDKAWSEWTRSGVLSLVEQHTYPGSFVEYTNLTLSGRTAFTLEGWIKPTIMGGDTVVVAGQYGTNEAAAAILISSNGVPAAYVSDTPVPDPAHFLWGATPVWEDWLDSSINIAPWHHLALVYDGTAARFYIDGLLADQQAQTGVVAGVSAPFRLGARAEAPGEQTGVFDGYLDSWALWPVALSLSNIQQRVADGLVLDDPAPDPNAVDLYAGFEGPFPSVQDFSHNNYAGHVVNHGNSGVSGVTTNGRAFRLNHDEVVDAGWSLTTMLSIPTNAVSGMYGVQVLTTPGFVSTQVVAQSSVTSIAIRPDTNSVPNPIAVVLPTSTWTAYNAWPMGGHPGTLEQRSRFPGGPVNDGGNNSAYNAMGDGISLSYWHGWRRPDFLASPVRPALADGYSVRAPGSMYLCQWLDAQGFGYDVFSDNDLGAGRIQASGYQVLMPNAHHEYWTDEMLHQMTQFLDGGGSVVAVSGNMMGWRVVLDPDGVLEVRKYTRAPVHGFADMLSAIDGGMMGGRSAAYICNGWYAYRGGYNFQSLGVVSHLIHPADDPPFGFGRWAARNADHWLWRGSGLSEAQRFGFGRVSGSYALGHEADTWVEGMPLPGLAPGGTPVILGEGVDFGPGSGYVNSLLDTVGQTSAPPSCAEFMQSRLGVRSFYFGNTNTPTVAGTILFFPHAGGGHVLAIGASATPWALKSDAALSGLLYRGLGALAYGVDFGGPAPGAPKALFVVGSAAPLGSADAQIKARLEAAGYTVVVRDDSACTSLDALGKALVLTSATVDPALVGDAFQQVPVPVVNWHPRLQPYLRETMALPGVAYGVSSNQVAINIVNAAHPLAAGLSAGEHVVSTAPRTFGWGMPNTVSSEPTIIATVADPTDPFAGQKALIYSYEMGAHMVGGQAAPRRRVHLYLADNVVAALSSTGLALMDAAIGWAAEVSVPAIPNDVALAIDESAGLSQISWPTDRGMGFEVETTSNLVSGIWTPAQGAVLRVGGTNNTMRFTPGDAERFFRLAHP